MQAASIQPDINQSRFLQTFRHAFTDSKTFILELVQNGRRAGASSVSIVTEDADPGETINVIVPDDGAGVGDFASLVTFAESGWGDDLSQIEQPYGVGLLGAIYAGERLIIESGTTRLDVATEDILAQKPVALTTIPRVEGTTVRVEGIRLGKYETDANEFASSIKGNNFLGYPIPVVVNGEEVDRPHAVTNPDLSFESCPVGEVNYPGKNWLNGDYIAYLQGHKVLSSSLYPSTPIIIHLDSSRFMGRVPDRNSLVNSGDAETEIKSMIQAHQKKALLRLRKELGDEVFARSHWGDLRRRKMFDVMNDLAYVNVGPLGLGITDINTPADHGECDWEGTFEHRRAFRDEVIPRTELASLKGKLLKDDWLHTDPHEFGLMPIFMWLHANGYRQFDGRGSEGFAGMEELIAPEHADLTDAENYRLVVRGAAIVGNWEGSPFYSLKAVKADSIEILGPDGTAVPVSDSWVLYNLEDIALDIDCDASIKDGQCLLISSGNSTLDAESFINMTMSCVGEDDFWDESYHAELCNSLGRFFLCALGGSGERFVKEMLMEGFDASVPRLHGKRFEVVFSEAGIDVKEVE